MFERIMGLNVIDEPLYQKYREHMIPILSFYGGAFVYDFVVSDVLKSSAENSINRVFLIEFPSKKIMEEFFMDPNYLEAKREYLDPSIDGKMIISMHEKNT